MTELHYSPPAEPAHIVDVRQDSIVLDGTVLDFTPGQLVALLGEPRTGSGIGSTTLYWDDEGIVAALQGGRVTGIDFFDLVVNLRAIVPQNAGRTTVTVEGTPVASVDWSNATTSQGEISLVVGANRLVRGAFPLEYCYWTVGPNFSSARPLD